MRELSFIIFSLWTATLAGQSPHGEDFSMDCAACHSSSSWAFDRSIYSFQHDTTSFLLDGQHAVIDCKLCHQSLEFSKAESICISCHQDIHSQSVGMDCARCHDANAWLVENISELHQQNGFPLMGVHYLINCNQCHQTSDQLRFDPIGNECWACHQTEFLATMQPNHSEAGYSMDCTECHNINSFEWSASGFNHDFFPLTNGHETNDCAQCHQGSSYTDISSECISCHQNEFAAASNPDHQKSGFSNNCIECHTTAKNWSPAEYRQHDAQSFPIYSGAHAGEWDQCATCHQQAGNFSSFSCFECHEHNQQDMDKQHNDVAGYNYNSTACLACHPNGNGESVFDHSRTNFPLSGAHTTTECLECHTNGYGNASSFCIDCHTADFNQAVNPNHQTLSLSTDCVSCHTTEPGWSPALLPNHNEFFTLNGAHAGIASDCASCHTEAFSSTPNTCSGCHIEDYNATDNPPHEPSGFSNDCASCHSENAWQPANFDHDGTYFPIYSGSHNAVWNECLECHTTSGNFTIFSCTECHEHNQSKTFDEHQGISGYAFSSDACLTCHPMGSAEGAFDHNNTDFPLTGAHTATECLACHEGGYSGTSNLCIDCHAVDFNQAANPNHTSLGLSSDCTSCHTTQPGWSPASFAEHNEYYVIEGAHAAIASDCASCHVGSDYANTPNTCAGCHIDDYHATTDPNHQAAGYSTECVTCHSQAAWKPANFDHNATNFPLTGAHTTVDCNQCHINGYAGTSTLCIDCHTVDFNQATNPNHASLGLSSDCASCHTTQPGWSPASFAEHNEYYVIEGAHAAIASDCASCHVGGDYANTPNTCAGCHIDDYNATTDPNHQTAGYSTECVTCHSQAAWKPANFDHNATNFPLTGAHTTLDCNQCHINGYTGTSTLCIDCHTIDFNQATNPNHASLGLSSDCASCHTTQPGWSPASFAVHNDYYLIEGAHTAIASDCAACHVSGDYANTPNTCAGCHIDDYNAATDPPHQSSGFSTDCATCHSQNAWQPAAFDHDGQYFPIYSGKHKDEWDQCIDCHTTSGNYAIFSCIDCHEHSNKSKVDEDHSDENGYQYNSNACYDCHPIGRAD